MVLAQSTLWQALRKTSAIDWWCSSNCFLIKSHECICLHTQPYINKGCTWGNSQKLLLSRKQLVHYIAKIIIIFFHLHTLINWESSLQKEQHIIKSSSGSCSPPPPLSEVCITMQFISSHSSLGICFIWGPIYHLLSALKGGIIRSRVIKWNH